MIPLLAVAALAAADGAVVPSAGDASVDEIVVTSRFRAEKLSDVPDSITAFTAADIERHRIDRINRVASLTPNLRFSDDQEVGVSTLVIRGVRQNRGTGQPPVSFRIDGVSATNNLLTTQELFDIESIDVLREKMTVVENEQYTKDYFDADKRYIGNAVQVFFKDGSSTDKVAIDFPIGHRERRAEGIPVLVAKFDSSVQPKLGEGQWDELKALCEDREKLAATAVDDFMALLVQ